MKQFLKNIIIYGTILTTSFTGLLFLSNSICRYFFKIKIPPQKNVLVVGTSHPESAINDNLIPRTKNMAQSGTCYFYTYIKSREIINHNPHIDTLVLGYSYGDISFGRNLWFFGEKNIQSKMRNYFFMFDLDDYLALLKGNPKAVIVNTPRAIINNLKLSFTGLKSLGGYKKLKKDNLKKDIIDHENHKDFYKKNELSKIEVKYLLETYKFCEKKNITLILLNVPIHPQLEKYQEVFRADYCHIAEKDMPNALLVNHSNFPLADSCFSDLGHINYKGAEIYTKYLNQNGYTSTLQTCNTLDEE